MEGQAPIVHPRKKLEGQALSCPIIILNEMEGDGRKNPVRAGLVGYFSEWRYLGEILTLDYRVDRL